MANFITCVTLFTPYVILAGLGAILLFRALFGVLQLIDWLLERRLRLNEKA